jgi:hypothetical protein
MVTYLVVLDPVTRSSAHPKAPRCSQTYPSIARLVHFTAIYATRSNMYPNEEHLDSKESYRRVGEINQLRHLLTGSG